MIRIAGRGTTRRRGLRRCILESGAMVFAFMDAKPGRMDLRMEVEGTAVCEGGEDMSTSTAEGGAAFSIL